ncbi:GNAT family N-acetyltransferase [Oceanobacillus piezotolerans]|uniref:GNAT family N-acetyltransferase n=1 Tax=Oceanobacillus piezotolerans TaxID=2448030 RepID=A0A498DJJ6_9BACI|nr:GNAT family N-acetyltransferase [Oceanobacillus piezotolerans]RLL42106.1 GNAT family N-acetyltransferase [Oceanobacillus piezotolerans]
MQWIMKTFQELTNEELYGILKVRVDVFVVEQKCAYPEIDNYDQFSLHYFLKIDNEIAAYARILPKGTKYKEEASIGRVLVVEKYRHKGYARELLNQIITFVREEWKEQRIKIQAQQYLKSFYASFGFHAVSVGYIEDGIPHIDMNWICR